LWKRGSLIWKGWLLAKSRYLFHWLVALSPAIKPMTSAIAA
jgi:hypothetical protein